MPITDLFRRGAAAFSTTLQADKTMGAASMTLQSAAGVPTTTAIDFTVGRIDSNGAKTPALKAVYKGLLAGTVVSSLTLVEGTDQLHRAGTPVEITFTAATHNDLITGITAHANQADGTLLANSVGATQLATGGVTASKIANTTITSAQMADGSVTPNKLAIGITTAAIKTLSGQYGFASSSPAALSTTTYPPVTLTVPSGYIVFFNGAMRIQGGTTNLQDNTLFVYADGVTPSTMPAFFTTTTNTTSQGAMSAITGYFSGLSAGSHTFSLWGQSTSGLAVNWGTCYILFQVVAS